MVSPNINQSRDAISNAAALSAEKREITNTATLAKRT